MKREQHYRVLEHTADVALAVRGRSLEELFVNAATGMFAQMVDLGQVALTVSRPVTVEAEDNEALLVGWLSELLYLRETMREAYARFQVQLVAPGRLEGTAEGSPCLSFDRPVKAVTYHGLKIEHKRGWYTAIVVFDV